MFQGDRPLLILASAAALGFFGGVGLVWGAYMARVIRRYLADDDPLRPRGDDEDR